MTDLITRRRQEFAIGVVGGPTTVVDLGGLRLVVDPTFDPAGPHGYLTKLTGPAVDEDELGAVDAVLVSHDDHPDNLDERGRRFALAAPLVVTGSGTAERMGPLAVGLAPWQTTGIPRGDGAGELTIRAVPAEHGPADGARNPEGNVNCEVTGFVLSGAGLPTVYVSGDNASIKVVSEVARLVGRVDVAVIFAGGARVPTKERGRPLTMTAQRAAAAAVVLGAATVVPAHCEGWAHFSEGVEDVVTAFDEAGLAAVLAQAPPGRWSYRPGGNGD